MNAPVYQLTKANWKTLFEAGLTDGSEGNGFANTTKNFDDNINCSKSFATYIQVKSTIYKVQYVDGCFYPVWYKQYTDVPDYKISKDNEIIRLQ